MSGVLSRTALLGVVLAIVAAACTPATTNEGGSTTLGDPATTTTTTTTQPATDADGDVLHPERGDPSIVARDVLVRLEGFEVVDAAPPTADDLLITMADWLPPDLVAGDAEVVYSNSDGDLVAVMSVIPQLTWRGDPGFVPDLIDALTGVEPAGAPDGIYSTSTLNGATLDLWSTGDGFVIASSLEEDAAAAYLSALDESTDPNAAWQTGTCLFLEHDEGLPYAPFPKDVVVPCSGAHNAEVLFGSTIGTDLATFDDDAIEYQRNYDCDRAYNEAFGAQRTNAPSLITYMPDADEWARGDRYLACVVIIDRNEGRQTFSGAMADLDDLVFTPEIGSCLLDNLPADTVECSLPHVYQFVGETTIDADAWPSRDDTVFDEACAPFLDGLEAGPGTLKVLAIGLGPYAFENGDRTVRCMAFATDDGFLVDVLGSFKGPWRLLGTDGVAT